MTNGSWPEESQRTGCATPVRAAPPELHVPIAVPPPARVPSPEDSGVDGASAPAKAASPENSQIASHSPKNAQASRQFAAGMLARLDSFDE